MKKIPITEMLAEILGATVEETRNWTAEQWEEEANKLEDGKEIKIVLE